MESSLTTEQEARIRELIREEAPMTVVQPIDYNELMQSIRTAIQSSGLLNR